MLSGDTAMPIVFYCPACSHRLKVADDTGGKRGRCPNCGVPVSIPFESEDPDMVPIPLATVPPTGSAPATGVSPSGNHAAPSPSPFVPPPVTPGPPHAQSPVHASVVVSPVVPTRVVVVDFDMPFGSMVRLMVKWSLAAIPAILILWGLLIFATICIPLLVAILNKYLLVERGT
jgi:hypothetical protein